MTSTRTAESGRRRRQPWRHHSPKPARRRGYTYRLVRVRVLYRPASVSGRRRRRTRITAEDNSCCIFHRGGGGRPSSRGNEIRNYCCRDNEIVIASVRCCFDIGLLTFRDRIKSVSRRNESLRKCAFLTTFGVRTAKAIDNIGVSRSRTPLLSGDLSDELPSFPKYPFPFLRTFPRTPSLLIWNVCLDNGMNIFLAKYARNRIIRFLLDNIIMICRWLNNSLV